VYVEDKDAASQSRTVRVSVYMHYTKEKRKFVHVPPSICTLDYEACPSKSLGPWLAKWKTFGAECSCSPLLGLVLFFARPCSEGGAYSCTAKSADRRLLCGMGMGTGAGCGGVGKAAVV